MSNDSGVSRGDRNRNARLSKLREAVSVSNAIVGIDLADRKQMLVVTDHARVLARRTFRCKPCRHNPITGCRAQPRYRYAGTEDQTGHRPKSLTQNASG